MLKGFQNMTKTQVCRQSNTIEPGQIYKEKYWNGTVLYVILRIEKERVDVARIFERGRATERNSYLLDVLEICIQDSVLVKIC